MTTAIFCSKYSPPLSKNLEVFKMLRTIKHNNPPLSELSTNTSSGSQIKPVGLDSDIIVISDDDDGDDGYTRKKPIAKRRNLRGKRKVQTPSRVPLIPSDVLEILTSEDEELLLGGHRNKKQADENENVIASGSGEARTVQLDLASTRPR